MKHGLTAAVLSAILFVSCAAAQQAPATIAEVLTADETFSTLVQAAETAGLAEALAGDGPLTLFAPTNEAFAALPEGELERLLADPEALGQVLSYHVVPERLLAANFGEFIDDSASAYRIETLEGTALSLDIEEDTDPVIIIDDTAAITQTDIEAGNGVVHFIDAVLIPGSAGDGAPDTMSGSGSSGGN